MTLRFFRRKSDAVEAALDEPPQNPQPANLGPAADPEPPARSASKRRGSRSSASRSKKPATPVSEEEESPPPAKPSTSKTRRGRRGGSRKTGATDADAKAAAAPALEVAPVISPSAEPGMLEALVAEHQKELQDIAERQVTAAKGLQSSLSAIENRLVAMSRLATERPRVGIFVDVPNVMYAAERLRATIDFGKMLSFIVRGRELVRASAYAPISDDPQERLDIQKFVQPFVGFGYRIVTKPLKRYADGSMKANFDVELAIDVLTMSDRLDIVTLVSGDGDFRRLVEIVESKGVRVEVVAFGQSTAAELRALADEYIDINDHLAELRAK